MVKAKVLPIVFTAFAVTIGAAVYTGSETYSAAAVSEDLTVTTVSDGEGLAIEGGTVTGFQVPSGVEGYFRVVVPSNVTAIAAGAFDASDNAQLSEYFLGIEIPATVTSIAADSFIDCKNLIEVCYENVDIGVADSGLYANAISRITSASDISLHVAADGTENYLFVRDGDEASTEWVLVDHAGTKTELTLPAPTVCNANCTSYSVYNDAFAGSNITSLTVPEAVTALGERAFSGSALTAITLNEGLKTIGSQAFDNTQISSVTFPASLETIADHAFDSCAQLSDVTFAERTGAVMVDRYAFAYCTAIKKITLPAKTTVRQYAFSGCNALMWVYVGEGSQFINTAAGEVDAPFFPQNANVSIVFGSANEYNRVISSPQGATFKNNHLSSATYYVNVNCYVGDSEQPVVYKRLHGENFNYVCDEKTGFWNTDTLYSALPVQAENYSQTVWYKDRALSEKVSWEQVNQMLSTQAAIDLYCYQTVTAPVLPAEPATWVYNGDVSYDINNLSEVLKALGSDSVYSEQQLAALGFDVVYTDSNSNVADKPASISQNGVYSVTVTLNPEYGTWVSPVASTITVNVDTGSFNTVLIVLSIIGAVAVVVTVSTAVIRKRVLAKNKKKKISSREAMEKYNAVVGSSSTK